MLKNSKKIFISASTLVCFLGWSTISIPIVANAASMGENHQQNESGLAVKYGKQNYGLHHRQQKDKQNNGLHLGQQKNRHDSSVQLGLQFFFNIITSVADILDVDEQTIIDKLKAGSTFVEIAESYNVSKSTFLSDLEDRIEATIDDAVTAGTITETQATEMKNNLTEVLTQVLESRFTNLNTSLSAPNNVTATSESDTKISLDWNSVSDATSYYVYRATSPSGTYRKIATVTTSQYKDDNLSANKTYYYKVKAHNSDDTSDYSSSVHATTD